MLEITLNNNRREYAPGEHVEGTVRWGSGGVPDGLVVALLYRTEGKGTQDTSHVEEVDVSTASALGEHGFRFKVPEFPYTFDGTLISLRWFVEASTADETVEEPITVSPWVEILRLQAIKEPDPLELLKQAQQQHQQQQQ